MPIISVIVPVFNAETVLPRALDSLMAQTFADFEAVCIDDGSTDGSNQIIRSFAGKDSRVKLFEQKNAGISKTRAFGIIAATGAYIAYLDADDWLEPTALATLHDALLAHNADIAFCSYTRVFGKKNKPRLFPEYPEVQFFDHQATQNTVVRRLIGPNEEELARPDALDSWGPVWAKLYRKSVIAGIDFADLKHIGSNEDGLFNIEAFHNANSCVFVNQCLYNYRKTVGGSLVRKYRPNLPAQCLNMYALMAQLIDRTGLPPTYKTLVDRRAALHVWGLGNNILKSKKSLAQKYKELAQLLADDRFAMRMRALPTRFLPAHWRLFYFFAKRKRTLGCFLMLLLFDLLM